MTTRRPIGDVRRLLVAAAAVASFIGAPLTGPSSSRARAAAPVLFDVAAAVECHDRTTSEFAAENPGERLIEARYQISVMVPTLSSEAVDQLLVFIDSPPQRLRVVDFAPRAVTASDVVGPITTVETRESQSHAEAAIGSTLLGGWGVLEWKAGPSAGAGRSDRSLIVETYDRQPPREVVVTAGTVHRGHGVFFKLRRHGHVTLEGVHELTCLYAVPATWRGDGVRLIAEAHGPPRSNWLGGSQRLGRRQVRIGLYLAGDAQGRQRARQFALAAAPSGAPERSDRAVPTDTAKPLVPAESLDVVGAAAPFGGSHWRSQWHTAESLDVVGAAALVEALEQGEVSETGPSSLAGWLPLLFSDRRLRPTCEAAPRSARPAASAAAAADTSNDAQAEGDALPAASHDEESTAHPDAASEPTVAPDTAEPAGVPGPTAPQEPAESVVPDDADECSVTPGSSAATAPQPA